MSITLTPEAALALAVEQFNAGQFFDCHETLEDHCWRPCFHSAQKTIYQGIIQLAVAAHHASQGNVNGAERLLDKAQPKLPGFNRPTDLDALLRLTLCFSQCQAWLQEAEALVAQ